MSKLKPVVTVLDRKRMFESTDSLPRIPTRQWCLKSQVESWAWNRRSCPVWNPLVEFMNIARKSTSNENLEVLLKEGAYAQLLEDNTEQSKTFCESNIDELLEKQSRIVCHSFLCQTRNRSPTTMTAITPRAYLPKQALCQPPVIASWMFMIHNSGTRSLERIVMTPSSHV